MFKGGIYLNTLIICTVIALSLNSILVVVNKNNKELKAYSDNINNYKIAVGFCEQIINNVNSNIEQDDISQENINIDDITQKIYDNIIYKNFSYEIIAENIYNLDGNLTLEDKLIKIYATCTNKATNKKTELLVSLETIYQNDTFYLAVKKLVEIN